MKKHVVIPFGICLLLVILSGFYLYREYTKQVETQKQLMVWYMSDTKTKLDVISSRAKELPHIVTPIIGEGGMLNKDINLYVDNISQLERYYIDNNYYIKGISVYDMFGDVFNLYRDKTGEFILDTYKSRAINVLRAETGVVIDNNSFSIVMPVYHGGALTGNVAVNIDIMLLHQELFKPYLENNNVWLTSILDEETMLTLPFDGEWVLSHEKEINQGVQERQSGFFSGKIKGLESSAQIVTYFESLMIPEQYMGIAFSSNISPIVYSSWLAFAIVFITLLFIAITVSYIINHMITRNREVIKRKVQEINLLQAICRSAPVAVMVTRNDVLYTANNSFFALLDGYVFSGDIGKNIRELNLPPCFQQQEEQELNEWGICTFDRNGKELCLGRQQVDMEMDGSKYVIDAFWDVTKMEKRLKNIVSSDITKSELLSRVSTDVKKTLGNVRDAVVLLTQQFPNEQHISYVHKLTAKLSGLVDDVQDYADIEAGCVVIDEMPFNLVEETKKVTDLYQPEIQRKGIELQTHVAASTIRNVVGDPQHFRQILNELLSNAVKFTNEGSIRISLETVELQNRKIMIKCSVEDTGQGISRQKLKSLFALDLRAKEGNGSIGLGVVITKKLINIMGGTLRATSPSPISTDSSTPGVQFSFSIICFSDQSLNKQLDYSSIVSYRQINALIVTSDTYKVQYLTNFPNRKGIHSDVFIYDKETSELLIHKLIIDKSRYQMVVIAAASSEMSFAIAEEIHKNDLTAHCLFVMVDASSQKGNYIRAKSLNMDYYFVKNNDLSIYEPILKRHFRNLSEKEVPIIDLIRKDIQILIAENNVLSQTVAKVIFKKMGYEVDLAQNALYLVNQLNHKAYDVIFIDLRFPPTTGFEIAEMLRLKGYKMPIIAMTSTLTRENLKRIADSGMDGYIPKPLNPESIKQALIRWFD